MKPTAPEKQWLQEYLYQSLLYRETYDEVYDHILLALENKPAQAFFESTVTDIIEEDFGGSNNMLNMEIECKQTMDGEVKAQYWRNAIEWCKFPLIMYTAVIWAAVFYLKTRYPLTILALFVILPVILISIRGFKVGKLYGDTKVSIRDSSFRRLVYRFFGAYILISLILSTVLTFITVHFHLKPSNTNAFMVSIVFFIRTITPMILVLHLLALLKLYRDEFKTGIIAANN